MLAKQAKTLDDRHLMRLYRKRARKWGENYLRRHWWRIAVMYDHEDLQQEALLVFVRVYRHFPGRSEADLFRIYKRSLSGLLVNRSKQCFPNPHAYIKGIGRFVTEMDEDKLAQPFEHEADAFLTYYSSVAARLPAELAEVLKLLIRDLVGVSCIEQRRARKTSGGTRTEPLNVALARIVGSNTSRDLLSELETALNEGVEKT